MSIKLMTAVFENEELGPTERLVMLALADHAGEDGSCYPSIERLRKRTGLSERAVQSNVKKLSEKGYIRVSVGGGKGNSNLYFISANPAPNAGYSTPNPAAGAPRSKCTPAAGAPQTPQQVRANPAAGAPEPSGTIIEPPPTTRETLLSAMGVGGDGIAGPSSFIGGAVDMAEAGRWAEMGLSVSQQCEVIREVCMTKRRKDPSFKPSTFRYFTPAMERLVSAKTRPVESQDAADIERWRKMASR